AAYGRIDFGEGRPTPSLVLVLLDRHHIERLFDRGRIERVRPDLRCRGQGVEVPVLPRIDVVPRLFRTIPAGDPDGKHLVGVEAQRPKQARAQDFSVDFFETITLDVLNLHDGPALEAAEKLLRP